jgi:hypothetical protein
MGKEMLNFQAWAATSYSTPEMNKSQPYPCTDLDNFDICCFHGTAHEERVPAVKTVLIKLWGTVGHRGQAFSLSKIRHSPLFGGKCDIASKFPLKIRC